MDRSWVLLHSARRIFEVCYNHFNSKISFQSSAKVKEGYIVFIPILIALLSSFLVLNQPDLGTAVIIFAPVLPMMLWAGVNGFTLFLLIAPVITIIAASNNMILIFGEL